MKKSSFDDDIRDKLSGLQEDFDPSTWDMLSSRLDLTDLSAPDDDFEPLIKEKLTRHEAPFRQEHWDLLNEELDYLDARRKRLYILKFAEAIILLLLLFTYWNYQQISKSNDVEIAQDFASLYGIESHSDIPQSITPPITAASSTATPSILSVQMNDRNMVEDIRTVRPDLSLSKLDHIKRPPVGYAPAWGSMNRPNAVKAVKKSLVHANSMLDPLPVNSIQGLASANSVAVVFTDSEPLDEVVLVNLEKRVRRGWWINFPVSYDLNVINTGFNFDYLTSHVNQGLIGQSVGLTVSYQMKNIEIESGFKYADKTYAPGLLSNYTKSSSNSFLESQLDAAHIRQVQIPVILKLHALNETRNNVYAVVGIGFNAILDSDYTIKKSIQPSARILTQDVSQSIVDLRKLPDGFAEGGKFNDNMYATIILGLGFQTHLKQDVAFYFQPQYQHQITHNLNSLIKKVHTLNIESGVRFKF